MTDLPGITSTTRTLIVDSERARSLWRLVMRLALTPGAACSSKRVMTGPGWTATTATSMPKSWSLSSTCRDMASSVVVEKPARGGGGRSSSDKGGCTASGGSNKETCCSRPNDTGRSARNGGTSILGLGRSAILLVSTSNTWARSRRTRRPCSRSVMDASASPTTSIPRSTQRPVMSMTRNHDRPVNKVTPVKNMASMSMVPPRWPKAAPTSRPIRPPTIPAPR